MNWNKGNQKEAAEIQHWENNNNNSMSNKKKYIDSILHFQGIRVQKRTKVNVSNASIITEWEYTGCSVLTIPIANF